MVTLDELKAMNDAKFNRAIAELAHEWHFEYRMALVGPLEIARAVVDYATDLNAAWGLLDSIPFNVEVKREDKRTFGVIWRFKKRGNPERYVQEHAHPARALATAWAAWMLAQGAANDER